MINYEEELNGAQLDAVRYLDGPSLVIAGAVGNIIDRVRLGYVVDFLKLPHWPVFLRNSMRLLRLTAPAVSDVCSLLIFLQFFPPSA